jgi:predicted RNA methylase
MQHIDVIEASRLKVQKHLDSSKTQAERNKLGQFATPGALATDILEYARKILPADLNIRFLDPAFGTGSFYSALLKRFLVRVSRAQPDTKSTSPLPTEQPSFGVMNHCN